MNKNVSQMPPSLVLSPLPASSPVVDISVIIVSWNARQFLEECLESLEPPGLRSREVIVVDNESTDGSPEMVLSRFPWAVLIQTGANQGFSKGNNIGIRRSSGKYLALVNSDAKVMPGCLDNLAAFLDRHTEVGMVGPRVMYGDLKQQSSCRKFPSLWNNTCEMLRFNKLFPRSEFFAGEHMFYFSYDRTCEVEVLVGCFILARRAAVEEFGLLDEEFWMYGEDLDWSHRCWKSGWKVMFYPGAEAVHYCGGSSANDPVRFELAQQKTLLLLWRKHYNMSTQLIFRLLLGVKRCLRLIGACLQILFRPASRNSNHARIQAQLACLKDLWGFR